MGILWQNSLVHDLQSVRGQEEKAFQLMLKTSIPPTQTFGSTDFIQIKLSVKYIFQHKLYLKWYLNIVQKSFHMVILNN